MNTKGLERELRGRTHNVCVCVCARACVLGNSDSCIKGEYVYMSWQACMCTDTSKKRGTVLGGRSPAGDWSWV